MAHRIFKLMWGRHQRASQKTCFYAPGLFVVLLCVGLPAQSRVFNMKNESVGSYLMFGGGGSLVKDQAFVGESTADSYDAEVKNNYSGEFGIITGAGPVGILFGIEILQPPPLKEIVAKAGGSKVYTVDSTIQVYTPKIGLNINLLTGSIYRLYISGAAGYSTAQIKNEYKAVSLSQGDHDVSMKGSTLSYNAGLGIEFYLMDTTTIVLGGDYRFMRFRDLRYSKDITTFTGVKTSGDQVTTMTGSNRDLDLSGVIFNLGFRFYF